MFDWFPIAGWAAGLIFVIAIALVVAVVVVAFSNRHRK
jgi:hypothetical protein